MSLQDLTTLPVRKTTRDRLRLLGVKGESWDALLTRLIDEKKSALVDASARVPNGESRTYE
jgi:hypothetical protein